MNSEQENKEELILFYYRNRVMKISREMLDTGYATLKGQKILLIEFVDTMFIHLPEQKGLVDDPNFDENVPYILMHQNNSIIKEIKENER